jgi:hypothetical protein
MNLSISLTGNLSLTMPGSGEFTPLSLSPWGWYDLSDLSTMRQSGTRAAPGAAVVATSPVGLVLDQSGNDRDLSQAVAGAKPTAQTGYVDFDGGDGLNSATGLTLPASADVFIVIYNPDNDTSFVTLYDPPASTNYLGYSEAGTGTVAQDGVGSPTVLVNGSAPAGASAANLYTALGTTATKVLEVQGATLTGWDGISLGNYAGFLLDGRLMEVVVFPALSAGNRTLVRDYLTTKHGAA